MEKMSIFYKIRRTKWESDSFGFLFCFSKGPIMQDGYSGPFSAIFRKREGAGQRSDGRECNIFPIIVKGFVVEDGGIIKLGDDTIVLQ